jgi:predicted NBD/HSP70 family sugar kinase
MTSAQQPVVVGLDNGGTSNNATVLVPATGQFLVEGLLERPSRVREGPEAALDALADALEAVLEHTGVDHRAVAAVGLDSPGPASADGVISSRGSTNFEHPGWRGFDLRSAFEARVGVPVVYNNDGNAAALYAHHVHHGAEAAERSSVSAVIGTGLGGGVVHRGEVVRGAAGMAGEIGHVRIPLDGLLEPGQPVPRCNCGLTGDAESFASLIGIERNLLPYWLTRYPGHPLSALDPRTAARQVRRLGEAADPLARQVFEQQAMALGRLLTVVANVLDPDTYFLGGGVVEAAPEFRAWFLERVGTHTALRAEQAAVESFVVVPDLDRAGARGSALAAAAQVASAGDRSTGTAD